MWYIVKMVLAFCLLASTAVAGADSAVTSEKIYFLEADGRHALVYSTSRTDYANYNIWFKNKKGYAGEDYIKNFLYIYPKEYTFDSESKKGFTILSFPERSFAGLERIALAESLLVSADGVFHFRNWRNKVKNVDGHYGLWNHPDNFKKIAYTWVFPETLEPVGYTANRNGEWVRNLNTITFYGSDVNDLVFDITYQPANHDTYESLKRKLSGDDVDITHEPGGIKISVAATVLYPSGVAQLSDTGKSILNKVAETLKYKDNINIIVAGHTDNVPISPQLMPMFPTNWELASARSLNVVHFLAEKGIKQTQLESRSFSSFRPVKSNSTEAGKAENRRIELLIEEKSSTS